jgi:hypothetical protein
MSARLLFTVADLGGADEITLSRPLEREAIDSTGQVEPHLTSFRVRPEVLQVTLARRDRAEVTLTADSVATVGSPKPGYLFRSSRIGLQPSAVSLTGPARVIEQLVQDPARIKLAPVDIAGRSAAVSQSVGLAEDLVQQGVSIEGQGEVLVTVPIEADDIVKPLVRVPIEYRNEGVLQERRVRATAPQAVDIQVVGPPLEINSRTDEDLLASIVLVFDWKAVPDSYFKTNQATYKVGAYTLDLPDTVSVADSKGNKEIKIEFTIEPLGPPGAVDGK